MCLCAYRKAEGWIWPGQQARPGRESPVERHGQAGTWLGSLSQDVTSSWLVAAEISYSGQCKGRFSSCSRHDEVQGMTALAQLLQCLSADGCDVVLVSALCPAFSQVPTVIWK